MRGMQILKEGDVGHALAPDRGRVSVRYEYRDLRLESGVEVRDVLVGVDVETEEVLVVPAQSTPKIKRARERVKESVLTVRVPRELDDVLLLIADRLGADPSRFSPALIRLYLDEAIETPSLAERLRQLSATTIARQPARGRITVRAEPEMLRRLKDVAADQGVTQSDLVRGAVLAAKEDVLDGEGGRRAGRLRGIARAV